MQMAAASATAPAVASTDASTLGALLRASFGHDNGINGAGVDAKCVAKVCGAVEAIARSTVRISQNLREHGFTSANTVGNQNAFGDAQLEIDVTADAIICDELERSGVVHTVSSEEIPRPRQLPHRACSPDCPLVAAFDPLDGSSVIATNFSVGSIYALWAAPSFEGVSGCEAVASAAAVYGPRTTLFVTVGAGADVWEVTLHPCVDRMGESNVRRVAMDKHGKLFAPANLRACVDRKGYRNLVSYYMENRYTLRYTGGMVPDVTQLLVKGYGVFVSPVSEKAPAKLRLLYEAIPMAMLVENAQGASSDGTQSLLQVCVRHCEQRTPVCLGSVEEIRRVEQFLGHDDTTPAS